MRHRIVALPVLAMSSLALAVCGPFSAARAAPAIPIAPSADLERIELEMIGRPEARRYEVLSGRLEVMSEWRAEIEASMNVLTDGQSRLASAPLTKEVLGIQISEEYLSFFETCAVLAVVSRDQLFDCRQPVDGFDLIISDIQWEKRARQYEPTPDYITVVGDSPALGRLISADRSNDRDGVEAAAAELDVDVAYSPHGLISTQAFRLAAGVLRARTVDASVIDANLAHLEKWSTTRGIVAWNQADNLLDDRTQLLVDTLTVGYFELAIDFFLARQSPPDAIHWSVIRGPEGRLAHETARAIKRLDRGSLFQEAPIVDFAFIQQMCRLSDLPDQLTGYSPSAREPLTLASAFQSTAEPICKNGRRRHAIWQAGLAATAGSVEP